MTPIETFLTENKQPITIFITARDKDLPHICLIALKSLHLTVHNEYNSVIEAHCWPVDCFSMCKIGGVTL